MVSVELLDHAGSDNSIANAARVSFGAEGDWNAIPEGYSEERRNGLLSYLAKHKHVTPFRHTYVSVRCKVPIFIARQLAKHQAGLSWNEVSRRYTTENLEFYEPEAWRKAPEGSIKQGSGDVHGCSEHWDQCLKDVTIASLDYYHRMIRNGVAPEQARMILPQTMMVEFVWAGNILAFSHVYNERSHESAQKEVQDFASKLNEVILTKFPVSWAKLTTKETE